MAHLTSISAAMFTDLSVAFTANTNGVMTYTAPATLNQAGFDALFPVVQTAEATKFMRVKNVREFPAIGSQPNIINVPVYGQRQSQTVGGQSDPPSLEVTINYVPSDWIKGTTASTFSSGEVSVRGSELGNAVGDGQVRAWRIALLAAAPTAAGSATLAPYGSGATGLGTVPNSYFYFLGKMESLLVTPSLTDATTATIAFSVQSDFYGPFTS